MRAAGDRATDSMSDDQLRAYRKQRLAELRRRMEEVKPQETPKGGVYPGMFFCTIYYTPEGIRVHR